MRKPLLSITLVIVSLLSFDCVYVTVFVCVCVCWGMVKSRRGETALARTCMPKKKNAVKNAVFLVLLLLFATQGHRISLR